eukprot:COSAG02_NODE_206_length_29144_cov_12.855121_21_plen_55_part_00
MFRVRCCTTTEDGRTNRMRTSAAKGVRWAIAEMVMFNPNLWVWNSGVSLGVSQR